MTNEIKEIIEINGTKYTVSLPKEIIKAFSCIDNELSVCSNDLPKILDYITNLQEEKKEMKDGWQQEIYDRNKVLNDWVEDERKINILQQRIDKAVEYCNNNIEFTPRLIDVIDILRGDE